MIGRLGARLTRGLPASWRNKLEQWRLRYLLMTTPVPRSLDRILGKMYAQMPQYQNSRYIPPVLEIDWKFLARFMPPEGDALWSYWLGHGITETIQAFVAAGYDPRVEPQPIYRALMERYKARGLRLRNLYVLWWGIVPSVGGAWERATGDVFIVCSPQMAAADAVWSLLHEIAHAALYAEQGEAGSWADEISVTRRAGELARECGLEFLYSGKFVRHNVETQKSVEKFGEQVALLIGTRRLKAVLLGIQSVLHLAEQLRWDEKALTAALLEKGDPRIVDLDRNRLRVWLSPAQGAADFQHLSLPQTLATAHLLRDALADVTPASSDDDGSGSDLPGFTRTRIGNEGLLVHLVSLDQPDRLASALSALNAMLLYEAGAGAEAEWTCHGEDVEADTFRLYRLSIHYDGEVLDERAEVWVLVKCAASPAVLSAEAALQRYIRSWGRPVHVESLHGVAMQGVRSALRHLRWWY